MDKVKIGVFGAARGFTMINYLAEHRESAELVAVCDKYKPLLERCGKLAAEKNMKTELFENFEDFFNCDMDAVVLANYANEHAPYAVRLLGSGRHVLSEVLTCATLSEAVSLADAVEKSGKIYCYAENYCYFKTTWEMRRRYRRGDIGELIHAEGEYIHDCSSIWPQITYGERDHWRNQMCATFYCTHSIGPILFSTGLRPVEVTGFEGVSSPYMRDLGSASGVYGMELLRLENGAVAKSIHGNLKREPSSINYQLYGSKGCLETDRWDSMNKLHSYIETTRNGVGEHTCCEPVPETASGRDIGHGGSDFYTMHYFINRILGDEEAKENCIDVYTAIDMCIPGILAYKSILDGGKPQKVPDFRDVSVREAYRNDTFCSYKKAAGEQYVPPYSAGTLDIPDEVYARVRQKWINGEHG